MKKLLGIIFLGLLLSGNAYAEDFKTTSFMKTSCEIAQKADDEDELAKMKAIDHQRGSSCLEYFRGIWDSALHNHVSLLKQLAKNNVKPPENFFLVLNSCVPMQATRNQLILVFLKFVDNNPQYLHEPLINNLGYAFQNAFPCPN